MAGVATGVAAGAGSTGGGIEAAAGAGGAAGGGKLVSVLAIVWPPLLNPGILPAGLVNFRSKGLSSCEVERALNGFSTIEIRVFDLTALELEPSIYT